MSKNVEIICALCDNYSTICEIFSRYFWKYKKQDKIILASCRKLLQYAKIALGKQCSALPFKPFSNPFLWTVKSVLNREWLKKCSKIKIKIKKIMIKNCFEENATVQISFLVPGPLSSHKKMWTIGSLPNFEHLQPFKIISKSVFEHSSFEHFYIPPLLYPGEKGEAMGWKKWTERMIG